MTDEKPPKPPSSLTQIPTAALPRFGFELKEAIALDQLRNSPEARARREQEEVPARRQAEFARYLVEQGKLDENRVRAEEDISPGDSLPPPPAKPSGRGR